LLAGVLDSGGRGAASERQGGQEAQEQRVTARAVDLG
jgi:hypothetical protein